MNLRTNHQKNKIRVTEEMKAKFMQGNIEALNLVREKLKNIKFDLLLHEENLVLEYKI